jgi:ubiquinone/menaquinone biosynthesis C-methylase UbiE
MKERISFVRPDVLSKGGVFEGPNIRFGVRVPFYGEQLSYEDNGEPLFGNYITLDVRSALNPLNMALIKKVFPGAEVHGILPAKQSYDAASKSVKNLFKEDLLRSCFVHEDDPRYLRSFENNKFRRVFDISAPLDKEEREECFNQAYRVLEKGGVYAVHTASAGGLGLFVHLRGKYNLEEIAPVAGNKGEEYERFLEDVRKICRTNGLKQELEPEDYAKIEDAIRNPKDYKGILPGDVYAAMKKVGFMDTGIDNFPIPGRTFVRRVDFYGLK